MNENDNARYDKEGNNKLVLKIGLVIIFILVIILLLILLSSGNKVDLYDELNKESRTYLNNNKDKYPNAIGECKDIKLSELPDNIKNNKSFKICRVDETYVKVCKISENDYQYTTILNCENDKTEFGDWKIGTIEDLKQNNSDVEFRFIPEEKQKGTKLYYPNDQKNINKVSNYYVELPADGYTNIDTPSVAYKWYSDTEGKDYYNNGEYIPTQPSGYPEKEDKTIKKYGSLTKPKEESYRQIEEGTIYLVENVAYPYLYECYDEKYEGTIISSTICERRNSSTFKKTKVIHYTCDGKTDTEKDKLCKTSNEWLAETCVDSTQTTKGTTKEGYQYTRNILTGYTCISTNGYKVSDEVWRWYKEGNVKKYYPSLSTISTEENTYYVSVPTSNTMKDESSITYAYRYYKFEKDEKASETWVSLTNKSLSQIELIDTFIQNGYDIQTLEDIEKNENIRYQIEISYRERK